MELIITSPEQLSTIIGDTFRAIVRNELNLKEVPKTNTQQNAGLSSSEGIAYLNERGYKTSESTFYKATSAGEIPVTYFGRRMLFQSHDLISWAEGRCKKSVNREQEVSMTLQKSSKRKR